MKTRWEVQPTIPKEELLTYEDYNPVIAQLLYNRGLTTKEDIEAFLHPDYEKHLHDPFLFRDMRKAVDRIFSAIEKRELIIVHGDYDSDGVCSSVLLINVLTDLGANCEVYLPHREKEGYGLNMNTVEYLKEQNAALIITVDCGISNVNEVARAQELGIDVIITDHHSEPIELPKAYAILNPKVSDEPYPYKNLAGVGVSFKLAQALVREDAQNKLPLGYDKWLLDLAAIATITDMMPLIGENRVIVKYGLIVLNKQRRPGLKLMLMRAGVLGTDDKELVNAYRIGFTIGPRINAAGRMEHANSAYNLLMSSSEEDGFSLVEELEENNKLRQKRTAEIIEEALEKTQDWEEEMVAVIVGNDWEMGLVGLVASRVKDTVNKPTFVITKTQGKITGSGRSIEEFNAVEALQQMEECFTHYGGHKAACGFSFESDAQLELFREKITALTKRELADKDLTPVTKIDAELPVSRIDWDLMNDLKLFEPFGVGNPAPVFLIRGLRVEEAKTVGQENTHLKLKLRHPDRVTPIDCIAFGKGEYVSELEYGTIIDIVGALEVNEWNGRKDIQIKLQDLNIQDERN